MVLLNPRSADEPAAKAPSGRLGIGERDPRRQLPAPNMKPAERDVLVVVRTARPDSRRTVDCAQLGARTYREMRRGLETTVQCICSLQSASNQSTAAEQATTSLHFD